MKIMENHRIMKKLQALRSWMEQHNVEVLVVPTMDPHNSEYVPAHWQCRQWLTEFTGSAGTAVVTHDEAYLWTDSRYWLQAEEQIRDAGFKLKKDLVDESINEWLKGKLSHPESGREMFVPDMMTSSLYNELFDGIEAKPLKEDPFDLLWQDRPALPLSQAEIMPVEVAGESAADKIAKVLQWMEKEGRKELLISELSELCWLLNLRGDDIPYNPFIIAFLLVRTTGEHTLYVHREQINDGVASYLHGLHVELAPYADAPRQLESETPIAALRAIKNPVEQEGFRLAHLRDGIAMVRFLRILDDADLSSGEWTEMRVDKVLTSLRAEQPGFRGLSFETISSYGHHGAVVHYEPTAETDIPLEAHSFLLLDSGGHYECGSTDITRTIPLGTLSDEERRVYTLVLKGHLQLSHMIFPQGTCGLQLDTAARMYMWREGYDYGHGTGHGVGHRLGVHEGPVQIRKNIRRDTTLPFHAGQNITIEPGIYVTGKFGVRIENTALVRKASEMECLPQNVREGNYGDFLCFEPLTLCPYDLRPVVRDMLTADEVRWINSYHQHVRETLMPHLTDPRDQQWLQHATAEL